MLYTLFVVLLVLWLLGVFVIPVGNAAIHILLVVALVLLVVKLLG